MTADAITAALPAANTEIPHRPPAKAGASPLAAVLLGFRRELIWTAIFGCFVNLLMLTPTLYMMQVFDRVMISNSEYTLAALSLLGIVFYLMMGFADWLRSRLLVRAGNRFDQLMHREVFRVSFEARLADNLRTPLQPLSDLTNLRQFLTGNGVFALVDTDRKSVV